MKRVFILSLTLIWGGSLSAQVHLRDTISISPRHLFSVKSAGTLVAPESGTIMIWPYELDQVGYYPIQDTSYVKIYLNDTLKYRFDVTPLFKGKGLYNEPHTFYNSCTGQEATLIESDYINIDWMFFNKIDSFYTFEVDKGDTMRFVYESEWEAEKVDPLFTGIFETSSGEIHGAVSVEGHPSDVACWNSGWGASVSVGEDCILNFRYEQGSKLVILQPTANTPDDVITSAPQMPTVVCKAQLQGYSGGTVTYDWTYETADTFLQETPPSGGKPGKPLPPRYTGLKFTGQTTATGSAVSEWTVPFGKEFTGGKTELIVKAETGDGKTYSGAVHAKPIIGTNPSPAEVRKGLTTALQVIVYMESSPKWCQFNEEAVLPYNRYGYPVYGPPHGYGLMQIDTPPATEKELWDWQANLDAGKSVFAQKEAAARAYPAEVRSKGGVYRYATDYSQEEYLTDAFQLYNGYHYWIWIPFDKSVPYLGGHWEKDPNLGKPRKQGGYGRDYGGKAILIYNEVMNGNPPSDW